LDKKKERRTRDPLPAPADADTRGAADLTSIPTQATGIVDIISPERIAGWAWNPRNPDESIVVEIYDGADLLIRIRADTYREDLLNAGIGTGRYGFSVPNPSALLPLARHQIAVRCAGDGVDLPGSPQWLLRPEAGVDSSVTRFLERASSADTAVARSPEDLDDQIVLTLGAMNQLLNARNSLDTKEAPLRGPPRLRSLLDGAGISRFTREALSRIEAEFLPLHFATAADPMVSIVIPVHNEFRTSYSCLKSIAENPSKSSSEIIVVDDDSFDETLFMGFLVSGAVQIVRNSKNLGFARCCNAGASRARGRYLLFLNNASLVRPGWLDELVNTFDIAPNVGIVGSKLPFEDGFLREAGGLIWRLGDVWNWGRQGDPDDPRYCFLRDSDSVSGAALMIERELFERLKGYDESYAPRFYEDLDLCFRARSAGKRVVVQPASQIVHFEDTAADEDTGGGMMKRYRSINHRKFYDRWKDTLSTHRYQGDQPDLEAERMVKRRAYFIDDLVPTPDQDAGSNVALQHMLTLMQLEYKVTFLPAGTMAQVDPYTGNLQRLGIECLYAPYYESVEEAFRRARVAPDLVYLHRFSNAAKYANLVRQYFPHCFTTYNVADLHFLRQQREMVVEGSLDDSPRVSERAELSAMRQVDSVIVHSCAEADILRHRDDQLRVHVVPWTVLPRRGTTPFGKRSGYAFIGGYGHRPNVDAAKYLAQEIAPILRRANPGIMGFLVGSNVRDEVTCLDAENLKVLGFVQDLTPLLHRLRCTVAPLRYGAGLKGKVLESFAHGLPCILTEVAAEGLNLPPDLEWLVARTPEQFSNKLSAVHEDESLNARLSEHGLAYIRTNFSAATTAQSLAAATRRKD
jgi:GT2 family glycosyltransferase/glycosyltransferase involved in cell wall biosynthesis